MTFWVTMFPFSSTGNSRRFVIHRHRPLFAVEFLENALDNVGAQVISNRKFERIDLFVSSQVFYEERAGAFDFSFGGAPERRNLPLQRLDAALKPTDRGLASDRS